MTLRKIGKVLSIVLLVLIVVAAVLCLTHLNAVKAVWDNLAAPHHRDGHVRVDGGRLL